MRYIIIRYISIYVALLTAGVFFFGTATHAAIDDPTDISNLKVWYDATDTSTLFTDDLCTSQVTSTDQNVRCWQDKSTNDDHATTVIGKGTPQYKTEIFNSLSALRFTKSESDTLRHELDTPYTSNFTFFIVMQSVDDSPAEYESFFSNAQDPANEHFQIDYGTPASNVFQFRADITTSFATFDNELNLYGVVHNGESVYLYSDGGLANAASSTGGQLFEQYRINQNRAGGSHHDSYISEVILYDDVLTACELEGINEYLSNKYGSDFSNLGSNYDEYGAPFTNDIAAIGEFASACEGSTAITGAGSSILTINNPSTLDIDDYLTFAHDNGGFATSTDAPGVYDRLVQLWRIDVDNTPGSVRLLFNLASTGLDSNEYSYVLLHDDDPTFSDAEVYEGVYTQNGDQIVFYDFIPSDGEYVTLGIRAYVGDPVPEFSTVWWVLLGMIGLGYLWYVSNHTTYTHA